MAAPSSEPPDWSLAVCQSSGTAVFFPERTPTPAHWARIRSLCGRCPIRAECEDYGRQMPFCFGVWGGIWMDFGKLEQSAWDRWPWMRVRAFDDIECDLCRRTLIKGERYRTQNAQGKERHCERCVP